MRLAVGCRFPHLFDMYVLVCCSQVQELITKHKKEMADHVTSSNAKYNEMLKERMNEEDKLHDEVSRQIRLD